MLLGHDILNLFQLFEDGLTFLDWHCFRHIVLLVFQVSIPFQSHRASTFIRTLAATVITRTS